MPYFETPPPQLAGDAIMHVRQQVVRLGGDLDWYRRSVEDRIAACDPQSPVEPIMAATLTGLVACGYRIAFESQYPVAGYVLDFAVAGPYPGWYSRRHHDHQVAVEVDGLAYHQDTEADALRDRRLEQHGWLVERFPATLLLKVMYAADYPYEAEAHGWSGQPDVPTDMDMVTWVVQRLRPPRMRVPEPGTFRVDRQEHPLASNPFADAFELE